MYKHKYDKYNIKLLNLQKGGINPNIGFATSIGKRPYQEDRIKLLPGNVQGLEYVIVSVFDGHGGSDTSEYLMNNLPLRCRTAIDAITTPITNLSITSIINDEFIRIDNEATPQMRGMYTGSTAVLCIIFNSRIFVANIADSPAILFSRDGRKIQQTNVHDCNNPVEVTRINADTNRPLCEANIYGTVRLSSGYRVLNNGSFGYDAGLDMTRAFGDNNYKPKAAAIPDIYIWSRDPGDILCVCSDSFLDSKLDLSTMKQNEDDIINEVLPVLAANGFNPQASVDTIVARRAATIPNSDNTSMIIAIL
jgi:protein phosphatase 1L